MREHDARLASRDDADTRRMLTDREVEQDFSKRRYISLDTVLTTKRIRGGDPAAWDTKTYAKL